MSATGRLRRDLATVVAATVVGACLAATLGPTAPAAAQAPAGTPWPVVTAAVAPPAIPVGRPAADPMPTAAPLPPVEDDGEADSLARMRGSPLAYAIATGVFALGIALYGWSAVQRLRGRA